jgi:hypothetical protein
MRCALHFCMLALLTASMVSPRVSLACLKLNEVTPGPGSDWDGDMDVDSKRDEWIEVVNAAGSTCDLSGYLLLNGSERSPVYGFSGSAAPGEFIVVYGSDAVVWESDNGHSLRGLSLNNTGDVVWLVDVSSGDTLVVDSLSYSSGDVGYDVSFGRSPDATGSWTLFDHFLPMGGSGTDPTPGASNLSDPPPNILGITRDPLYPTSADSTRMIVDAGDASGITQVLLAYDINLEDGEEPEMELVSGLPDLGTWVYTILPCAAGDTVHYRVSVFDPLSSTVSPWMGYRVRSDSIYVRINEILADPPADMEGDANMDGERDASDDEFIEIVNCGASPVDMSGWRLSDAMSVRHVFPDSGFVLLPGEFLTVFGGGTPTGFLGKVVTASSGGLSLANTGDVVSLSDVEGSLVDIQSYGGEGGGDQSMIRYPDCSDTWMLCSEAGLEAYFTPQAPNDGQSAVTNSTWGTIKSMFK